ncbi:MAG TPA: TetR/AcrR family transcriptional regulator [Elusimicrobiales bacterium]|nr:TetR/AcrR family transcriptional regulator [Elusimicrobiales bacterium]
MKPQAAHSKDHFANSDMKSRILHAALFLMAEKGLEKTSVNDIVRAVNVTKPVLYYYFKNKEDLCKQIIQESIRQMQINMRDASGSKLTVREFLFDLFNADIACFRANPEIGKIVMKGLFASNDRAFHKLLDNIRHTKRVAVRNALQRAATRGEIPPQSTEHLSHIISAITLYLIAHSNEATGLDERFVKKLAMILSEGAKAAYAKGAI